MIGEKARRGVKRKQRKEGGCFWEGCEVERKEEEVGR